MRRITALIVVFCFLLILMGCAETSSTPVQKPESTSQVPTTDSESISEAEPAQAETADETQLAEVTTKEFSPNPTAEFEFGEPVLLEGLIRNSQSTEDKEDFKNAGLSIGQVAINFTLKDTQDNEFRLSRLLAEKPVVMIFGSFT